MYYYMLTVRKILLQLKLKGNFDLLEICKIKAKYENRFPEEYKFVQKVNITKIQFYDVLALNHKVCIWKYE